MKEDLYNILDINKDATDSEIKKAYRSKVKIHHPDKEGGDETIFKKVAHAYEVLSDKEKREIYDLRGHDGLNGNQQRTSHQHNFHEYMRAQQEAQEEVQMKHNASIRAHVSMTVEDVFNGVEKTFEYNRRTKCDGCEGDGGSNPARCTNCNGTGTITSVRETQFGYMQHSSTCATCKGVGLTYDSVCSTCHGNGIIITRERHVENIPYGMLNGEQIIVPGKGHIMPSGEYGDLIMIIQVQVNLKFVITNDYNLTSIVKIPYEILILGGKIDFNTIDNAKVRFTVPKFSKVGNKLKLKDKGLKKSGWKHLRGDQIIILDVEIPTEMGDVELNLLEEIKKLKE